MPMKTKVKFTEKENQAARKDATSTSPPPSDTGNPQTTVKKKSKRLKTQEQVDSMEEESYEDIGQTGEGRPGSSEFPVLTLSDPDKNVSDGSITDVEVPPVKWLPADGTASTTAVCSNEVDNSTMSNNFPCSVGVALTVSQKISPCVKSDNQDFATTDYVTSAALSFIPTLIHPINGQVSTFIRHREFTDYLRNSGFLRLFGTCILNVYRMKALPPYEDLMEQILNAMGYQIPARKQVEELKKLKQALTSKLKVLTKERCQLLEKLDEYQDASARYELLDQDEILPPRPENTPLNMELMSETFRNMQFVSAGRDEEATTELRVIVAKPAPVSDTLAIPYHDKRVLQ